MRTDRSRIRVLEPLIGLDTFPGLLIGYGPLEVEVWPSLQLNAKEVRLIYWAATAEMSDENRVLLYDLLERRILEELDRLSAHQRIAMIRDGLLIPEPAHPGEA